MTAGSIVVEDDEEVAECRQEGGASARCTSQRKERVVESHPRARPTHSTHRREEASRVASCDLLRTTTNEQLLSSFSTEARTRGVIHWSFG